jgi:YHS domain-containing protein
MARERFRTVLVHADHREDLMARYGVARLPTTVLLDADGREIARVQGYRAPEEFLGFLQATEGRMEPQAKPPEDQSPGLGGKCPVTLVERNTLTDGRPDLTAVYDGREYRFRDPEARDRFLADPIPYIPAQRGLCPVTLLDQDTESAGDPRFGVYYRDRLYLCRDEPSRRAFARDPERYAFTELAGDGYCPHCRATEGRLVRGESHFSVIHDGRRYEFPDETHRQAFRDNPERFVR